MPKVSAKIIQTQITSDGRFLAKAQFEGKLPKEGSTVSVKWGSTRSIEQNSLYWVFLTWCIDHGLKDQGHFDPQALHLDLKAYFLSEKKMDKGQFKAIETATTTQMNKSEFGEYMDKIGDFVASFFGLDTSSFWEEYQENYGQFR